MPDRNLPRSRRWFGSSNFSTESLAGYAWMMVTHSLSKARKCESKKSRNRLRLDNSVSHVTSVYARVRNLPRIYVTYCFRGCTTTKGSLHGARFAPLISLTLLIVRFRIHPSRPPSSQFHEWALLCYDVYHEAETLTVLRATDSGANVIIFRNLLSRCSPLWSRRRCRWCHSVAGSLFSRLVSNNRRHCDILPLFCRAAKRIFLQANPCNREIFISVYGPKYGGRKRNNEEYMHTDIES